MNKVVVCGVAATGVQPRSEKNALRRQSMRVSERKSHGKNRTHHDKRHSCSSTYTDRHTHTHAQTVCRQSCWARCQLEPAATTKQTNVDCSAIALALLSLLVLTLALLWLCYCCCWLVWHCWRLRECRERERVGTTADDKCTKLTESCSVMKCKLQSCHLTCR